MSMIGKKVWRDMGLSDQEFSRICELLGRKPSYEEIGIFSVMWSEHCSYKHSKPELRKLPTTGAQVLQGPGENAGIIDIGDGQAVVFKMESHNHPSAIEPYQGAATGVGGIVRDVFTMGARPFALLNSLRFGPLEDKRVRYLVEGVVAGIAGYGNCLGIPTVAGEVYFADSYKGNPLVNAMCVGLVNHEDIRLGVAAGVGNAVMLIGAKTGRDGIHGATFASEELSDASAAKRPSVQVGDPFMEKLLIEACLELIEADVVVGMQDLGAAGLTSSSSEMASREGNGIDMDLSKVPLRETGMTPYEILLSESQERMLVVVKPENIAKVNEILAKWGLDSTVIGQVTGDGHLRVRWEGEVVADIPAHLLADEAPVVYAQAERPAYLDVLHHWSAAEIEMPNDLEQAFLQVLTSPNVASKEWVYRQYDHMVQTNTVVIPGADAAVMRVKGTDKGVALCSDCNPRFVYLDPYSGGKAAVAEAARNIACVGAKPLGITNCLNFGNPEKPEIFYTFKEALRGMGEACQALNTPVTGGNVSFYNEINGQAVYPTPTIGMVGLITDVDKVVTSGVKQTGDQIFLLGDWGYELGGSEYLATVHQMVTGMPPQIDLELESRLQQFLIVAAKQQLISSAHDISEGGLICCLAEKAIAGNKGIRIAIEEPSIRTDVLLFNESAARVVISCRPGNVQALREMAKDLQLPLVLLGDVGGTRFKVSVNNVQIDQQLADIRKRWKEALACSMSQN